jgi:hypothetical protein
MNHPTNRKSQRREQAHIKQGQYNKSDTRPFYTCPISDLVEELKDRKRWGDDQSFKRAFCELYRNGGEMYRQAEEIVNSPLSEALREGEEPNIWGDVIITNVNVPNGTITVTSARQWKGI